MAIHPGIRPTDQREYQRRYAIGAEPVTPELTTFRVWAPGRSRVEVVIDGGGTHPLHASQGYFAGEAPAPAGTRYWYLLDGELRRPDPMSRYQPEGPHGPSQVVDPGAFRWTDEQWPGITEPARQVMYELHVGTFTREGTYLAAIAELPRLRDLGVTTLELMPLADFVGRFGWGYDGVNLFAPSRLYGTPDELRRLIDAAHANGLAVLLDVVYNHLGSEGNYLADFSPHYHSSRHASEWGASLNYDGEHCEEARRLVTDNAAYWISEYHFDGLRLDATQQIFDDSAEYIVGDLVRCAERAAGRRKIFITAENEPQHTALMEQHGVHAMWNDDFHHSARVALTGKREAYYGDYCGTPQELISAAKYGFLFQGQWYDWQEKTRGTPALGLPPSRFVTFIENHDQVANDLWGARIHQVCSPGKYRAMLALLLLGPEIPLLFMGQEVAASAPFHYFADLTGELGASVRKGRHQFMSQFQGVAATAFDQLPDPTDPKLFERCKVQPGPGAERASALHRDLLAIRRDDGVVAVRPLDGAVIGPNALLLRYFGPDNDDRLLLVNLGFDLVKRPAPEPLLAPPAGQRWEVAWSSERPEYGGTGTPPVDDSHWWIPGEAAVLLRPVVRAI